MFGKITIEAILDTDFKEDSVRELIVLPILNRLGYNAVGSPRVSRSKTLKHPFIRIGTKNHPVSIIPDYSLYHDDTPIFILDAKSPSQDILDPKHVQQAYSYAYHPEMKCREFGLCNGSHLAIFSVQEEDPILLLKFEEFEHKWNEIEKILKPANLLNPKLRRFNPDFGFKILQLGHSKEQSLILPSTRLNTFVKLDEENFTASSCCEFAGEAHMVSFDFSKDILHEIVSGLPKTLKGEFLDALSRSPYQASAGLHIEVDLEANLGAEQSGTLEKFIPLVVKKVMDSRFIPVVENGEPEDIPPHIYQLHKRFRTQNEG